MQIEEARASPAFAGRRRRQQPETMSSRTLLSDSEVGLQRWRTARSRAPALACLSAALEFGAQAQPTPDDETGLIV